MFIYLHYFFVLYLFLMYLFKRKSLFGLFWFCMPSSSTLLYSNTNILIEKNFICNFLKTLTFILFLEICLVLVFFLYLSYVIFFIFFILFFYGQSTYFPFFKKISFVCFKHKISTTRLQQRKSKY